MAVLFSGLSSRRSDSLSDTALSEQRLSGLSNESLHTCYEPNQKAPRRWVTSFKSSLNPTIVGKKKARRNRVLVVVLILLALGGIAVLTSKTLVCDPVTVVGTGNTVFELVVAEEDRYVFFDAPLNELARNSTYTLENSYYASVSLKKAVGVVWPWGPTDNQKQAVQKMISAASERGLLSRFWDIPSWPVSLRMRVWRFLVDSGVGMLNVDDVVEATRWNWDWCIVAGLVLC
ncbi:hypothetical protein CDV55_107215 [Aspergillus turcosus]|uniref:Altered inheritance of mitochondria protein 6 n=1 Tax=Aspergillus turcosus TaxID=1245748 RepID=A0A229YU05_9EURO|nr:hypothetical protein CDV55_107215 [Aspergillus turcosus]RLL93889.1 hypothetical protein CFD26_103575 [Aspergillus turcosus]